MKKSRRVRALGLVWGLVASMVACSLINAPSDVATAPPGVGGTGADAGSVCGNGALESGEGCDDGNQSPGDGCDQACTVEAGWMCPGSPSQCVKCGNGTRESNEECDDSNTASGDGCSADCKMEGSCSAPLAIALTQMGDGLIGHATASTGLNDVPQVSEGQCIGGMAGGGTDRIYKIDLMGLSDLEVRVGAQFDAVVRVMTSPCMLKDQLPGACADQVGVAAEERVLVPGVAAGTYYIVVDGKSAGQSGNFSVDVAARCPLENVRIDRVVLESPFRTHIVNTNPKCGVDMSRIGIFSQPEATDTPGTLPAQTLAPFGRRILTTQTPPPMMQLYQGNIPYDTTNYAGAFYLCRGPCDKLNGLNVYDAIRWKGTSGSLPGTLPLPRAVMFDAEKAALTDRLTTSYYRVLTEGVAPNFKATDFEAAYFVETFEDQALDGWSAAAPAYMTAYETGKVGNSALALSGANPSMTAWDGPRYPMVDNAGMLMTAVQPTSVSLWASASETTKNA
ncbi:MAG TPA: myxococcus cysteine-rich repeat containing protein, partial [Polyangiaceae bacterium]